MASGFFAIFDDIAALMDDVAVATKVATQKTVGILGDDLAVNSEKATGFVSSRELPVLWAITKGSLLNKLIIIPVALLLSAFFPAAIQLILILGGFYLAYEGAEKIIEYFFHPSKTGGQPVKAVAQDDRAAEKTKIKSAITTDFILSIEIVIIALGTVLDKSLTIQLITVSVVAILATVGVYGFVALIVRIDDVGYKLIKKADNQGFAAFLGSMLIKLLPVVIKFLSVAGTLALLLVSGGIFVHRIGYLHHLLPNLPDMIREFLAGLIAGLLVFLLAAIGKKARMAMR